MRWLEECLPPDDYEGYAQLKRSITSMMIATGEHEYTRYGFRELISRRCAGAHLIELLLTLLLFLRLFNTRSMQMYFSQTSPGWAA